MKLLLLGFLFVSFGVFAKKDTLYPPSRPPIVLPGPIVEFPEKDAAFPGGKDSLNRFIDENLQYPEVAKEANTRGTVYVSFVVGMDGAISQIEILRGVSAELDQEAKRIIQSMPNWISAKVNGKAVRSRCRLPIKFVLPE
ncbi:energy transducer TonB [bacterium]|nr:energy transducer TonB [bacterium]MDC0257283.1 energy transducer TonB [Crocinitomicaceae bacterium]